MKERIHQLLDDLSKFPSISASAAEAEIGRHIHEILAKNQYFRRHPAFLQLDIIESGEQPAVVSALLQGRGSKTVVLLNHHDVVDAADYRLNQSLAFNPRQLTQAFAQQPGNLPSQAQVDLNTGQWLFGRGVMDMKYGIALQIAMLEKLTATPENLPGNVLFLSVPDEENNSLGMRHAVGVLRRWQQEYSLDFVGYINSEPCDSDEGYHSIQTGSDGKLLPLIYCVGQETHAGALYQGLNSNLLLAEVIRLLELNPGFCDSVAGFHTLPPTVLKCGDLKPGYNVSTPTASYAFFNIFTLAATPEAITNKLTTLCRQAFENCLEKLSRSLSAYNRLSGENIAGPEFSTRVMTYAQLVAACKDAHGQKFTNALAKFSPCPGLDDQQHSLEILNFVHQFAPDFGPKIIVAFAPPFYPPVRNQRKTDKEHKMLAVVEDLQAYARKHAIELRHEEYHRGISDLSFCGLQQAEQTITSLSDNCPGWDQWLMPFADIEKLSAPVLNLGPRGRDFHKQSERLHLPFALATAPTLLEFVITRLLTSDSTAS
ncbi:MAG: M20/M25/M40 family metallo-hydrolase [Firmicutes bacterium]|nr:M20/M25/M40 family metallo-hydrolase [Bacillota bacterium]